MKVRNPSVNGLSLALFAHYVKRGRESALRVDQDAPLVEQMRVELSRLFEESDFIEDRVEVAAAWSKGFSDGIQARVRASWAVPEPFLNHAPRGWDCIEGDDAAADRKPVVGTLHLVRKGGVR